MTPRTPLQTAADEAATNRIAMAKALRVAKASTGPLVTYLLGPDGSLTAGDRRTARTAYAYPRSPHALQAQRDPVQAAREMLDAANAETVPEDIRHDYDARHWANLFYAGGAVDIG